MMGHEWIRNMNVHSLPHGHHQPFYNVLVEDGSCRYAAQGKVLAGHAVGRAHQCVPRWQLSMGGHT